MYPTTSVPSMPFCFSNIFLERQADRLNELTDNNKAVYDVFLQFDKALANNPFAEINATTAEQIGKCMVFAAEKHQGQKRKDAAQTPYIVHPIGVALILLKEGEVSKTAFFIEKGCNMFRKCAHLR